MDEKEFNATYAKVMKSVWGFSENDQRPHIRSFFENLRFQHKHVVDIGAGDGYYWNLLDPDRFFVLDPLFGELGSHNFSKFKITVCESIGDLKLSVPNPDLALLIHTCFYLDKAELEDILEWLKDTPLVIVNPEIQNSITTKFEISLGIANSEEKAALVSELLGTPKTSYSTRSHFRTPKETTIKELAFLVSHLHLKNDFSGEIFNSAINFVERHIHRWEREDWYELPQSQLIQFFER